MYFVVQFLGNELIYVYLLHGRCMIPRFTGTFIVSAVRMLHLPYMLLVSYILFPGSNKSHAAQDNGTRGSDKTSQKSEQAKDYWTPDKVTPLLLLFHNSCTIFSSTQSYLEDGA